MIKILLFFIPFFCYAGIPSQPPYLHIPYPMPNKFVDANNRVWSNSDLSQYNVATGEDDSACLKAGISYPASGYSYTDGVAMANVSFGNSEQYVKVTVHTGTVHLWGPTYCNKWKSTYMLTTNTVSTCPTGYVLNRNNAMCEPINLNSFNNDSIGCSKNGGTFIGVGTKQVGGTSYGADFFGGHGIMLGGHIEQITKCVSTGNAIAEIATNVISLLPFASTLFKSLGLKKLSNLAVLDKLQQLPRPNDLGDFHASLPKITGPNKPIISITEKPIPTSTDSQGNIGPSRGSDVTTAPEYAKLDESFLKKNTAGDVVLDHSTIDAFNRAETLFKDNGGTSTSPSATKIEDFIAPTPSRPVKESFDFSSMVADKPQTSYNVSVVTETTTTPIASGGTVSTTKKTTTFTDGSSSIETVRINPIYKTGDFSITSLAPTGETQTSTRSFIIPDLVAPSVSNPNPSLVGHVKPTGPWVNSTPSSVTPGVPSTIPYNPLDPNAITDPTKPQDILNAQMSAYSLPDPLDFVPFDSNPITDLVNGSQELFNNVSTQLATTKTTFDNTMTMINGGWVPPVIPVGACGDSMAFNFHGKHIDLCPPLAEKTAVVAPIVSTLFTIGGMVLGVTIVLGGL